MTSGLLSDRRVAITGASRGIGRAIAQRLVDDGASVALCARSAPDLNATMLGLRDPNPRSIVVGEPADVTDATALERFAASADAGLGGVNGLVCNAGIWGPKGPLEAIPWDEWLHTFDVNVHGVARTVRAFLPILRRSGNARIVILSGGGATKPMANLSAYSATKSAVVRLGETLAEELRDEQIPVNMIAPGAVNTSMLDELLAAGPALIGEKQYRDALKQRDSGGTPPEKGADLCAYLFGGASPTLTGKLISAVWDPWPTLADHADELATSDIYTLRRIVPADRGAAW